MFSNDDSWTSFFVEGAILSAFFYFADKRTRKEVHAEYKEKAQQDEISMLRKKLSELNASNKKNPNSYSYSP